MWKSLIGEYRELVEGLVDRLDAGNLDAGIAVAAAAFEIAGYGPVKDKAIEAYEQRLKLLAAMHLDMSLKSVELAVRQL